MADRIGRAVLELATESSAFFSSIDKAADKARSLGKVFEDSNRQAQRSAGGLRDTLASLVPAATIAGAGLLVKQFTDVTGALVDMRANTGLSLTSLQRFKFGAEQTGSSLEAVVKAVQFAQKSIADGDKSFIGALEKINVKFDDLKGQDPAGVFELLTAKINAVQDPAERTALRMALLGKTGRELNGDFKALGDEASKLGIVMKDEVVEAGDDLGDNWDKLTAVGKGLIGSVLAPMLPALNGLATGIISVAGPLSTVVSVAAAAAAPLLLVKGAAAAGIPSFAGLATGVASFLSVLSGVRSVGDARAAIQLFGESAGITTAKLGLLGSAASVAAAAFVGWQIGRLIADLTGLDGVVQRATENLLGYAAAKDAATSGAKQDVINKAIREGAAANITYAEAIKYTNAVSVIRAATYDKSAAAQEKGIKAELELGRISKETANARLAGVAADQAAQAVAASRLKLTDSLAASDKKYREEVKATGYGVAELTAFLKKDEAGFDTWAKEVHLSDDTIKRLKDSLKSSEEAHRKHEEAVKKAGTAADEFNKQQDDLIKRLEAAGIMTQEVTASALTPLIEALNEAAKVGDKQLAATLKDQAPLWDKVAEAVRKAGGDVTMVTSIYEAFVARAGLPVASSLVGMETAIRQLSVGELVSNMGQLNGVGREVAAQQEAVNASFEAFGLQSPAALRKVAESARANYAVVSTTAGATKQQVKEAWDQMVAAQLAAQGKVPSAWKTEILPAIVGTVKQIGTAVEGSFAQMLLGAKGFHDGFLDIWNSLKAGVARILTEILGDFTHRFLKGLLASLTGAQGGFAGAFAGLFGGGGGGGVGGLIPGLGGLFGGGGAAAGEQMLLPGMAAGGGGLFGLGSLGTAGLIGGAALGGYGLYKWLTRGQRKNMAANDERDTFLSQFGGQGTGEGSGFGTLAAKLTEATGEAGGGSLFKGLMDAHTPEDVAKAIERINVALADYAKKTAAATENEQQQADAIAKTKAEIDEKTKSIHAQMSGLDDELKKLNASEAPEAHMGTVEKRARERIAREKEDLQHQLDAAEQAAAKAIEAIKAVGTGANDELKTQGQDTISGLKDHFVDLGKFTKDQIDEIRLKLEGLGKNIPSINIPIHYDTPSAPHADPRWTDGDPSNGEFYTSHAMPMADGGFGRVTRPTLFLAGEAGAEDFAFSGGNQRFGPQASGPTTRVLVVPAIVRGRPDSSDVDDLVATLARAEPAIAGNTGEVRTRLRAALGLA